MALGAAALVLLLGVAAGLAWSARRGDVAADAAEVPGGSHQVTPDAAPTTSSTARPPTSRPIDAGPPTTTRPPPEWIVGAQALPLRPDGFGQILPTPEVLVERSLSTPDRLLPPDGDAYEWSVTPLDEATIARIGRTWAPGCPVGLDELRLVSLTFWGFDGGHHRGELVVHRDVADEVAWVFGELHAARFPLEDVRVLTSADLDAPPTGDGNVTAGFVCRTTPGGSMVSAHARGLAVDVNPFYNPYVRGDLVIPELASAYVDRSWHRPGMVVRGDVVTAAFAAVGWSWAGEWASPDHMHFSATGR